MATSSEDLSLEAIRTADNGPTQNNGSTRRGLKLTLIVLGAALILAAVGVAVYVRFFQDRVSSDDAQVDGHIVAVAPKIQGTVLQVLVRDNQAVKAGDVLVRIDPRDYQARVDQMQAAVLKAESELRSAQATVPLTSETTQSGESAASARLSDAQAELERARIAYQEASSSDVSYARANIAAKEANNERAQADLARMKPLLDKAEISQQQYDSYLAAARVAHSELEAVQEKLASAQQDAAMRLAAVGAAQSQVNRAQAEMQESQANRRQVNVRTADAGSKAAAVEQARADLEAAQLQLGYTVITAPADGLVTRKSVEAGQMVQQGQGLMAIIPLSDVWVTANFKETELARVRPGQAAEIHVDMYGKSVRGHVDSIAAATGARMSLLPPENASGNFVKVVQRIPVKILVDQTDGLILRPGMNVEATIFAR
jgi:membrane fusion protein, multidrug efflux system